MISIDKIFNNSAEKLLHSFFGKVQYGQLDVIFPSGKKKEFLGNEQGIKANIQLNNFLLLKKLFNKGSLGFAESYMDGDFSTSNLAGLLYFAHKNEQVYIHSKGGKFIYKFINRLFHYLNNNSKSKSKENISYHYDLGNNFYSLWLDESMTYSSGFFELPYDDLFEAQSNKFKKITEPMLLNDNSSLLEIGCGWGSFATYVAKNFGSKVNAITISKKQFDFTTKKIFQEGLNEKVTIQLKDYRDINEKYDYISSIEMFEAVGQKYWSTYFSKIKNSLKNDGLAALQIITINEKRREYYQQNPDFIQKYIFPGGILASKNQLYQVTSSLGISFKELNSFGNSYANTLDLWNKKFQNKWLHIAKQGFSIKFKRMWEYYLAYCEVGFKTKSTDVSHFLLK